MYSNVQYVTHCTQSGILPPACSTFLPSSTFPHFNIPARNTPQMEKSFPTASFAPKIKKLNEIRQKIKIDKKQRTILGLFPNGKYLRRFDSAVPTTIRNIQAHSRVV